MSILIGIPKEILAQENRVALIPDAVRKLIQSGYKVLIEQGAGLASGFADKDFQDCGAEIVGSPAHVYERADVIQKVKEPQPSEWKYLKKNHVLFCFLHYSSPKNSHLLEALLSSQCTAIAYEMLRDGDTLPILTPMSIIAGGLAALYGVVLNREPDHPHLNELLLAAAQCYPEQLPLGKGFRAVIFGGGPAGITAYGVLKKMTADPVIIEVDDRKRAEFRRRGLACQTMQESQQALRLSEIWIGAAHMMGKRAPQVINFTQLADLSQKKKKVMIDIAIDEGGNFPNAVATSYSEPCYRDELGNLRFGVPNIPSIAGKVASTALSDSTIRYSLDMALAMKDQFSSRPWCDAVITKAGQLLCQR